MTVNKIVSIRNRRRKKSISLTRIYSNRSVSELGFSLLEYMISVVIIAILITILIPNINGIQDRGHQRSVQLTANALQLAVNVTHSLWMSRGIKKPQSLLIINSEQPLLMNQLGWPIDALDIDALGTDALAPEVSEKTLSAKEIKIAQLDLSGSSCRRLWIALLKDSAPKVGLDVEFDSKNTSHRDSNYAAQLENGICRYRYRLNQDGLRIHYDLATGQVITLF